MICTQSVASGAEIIVEDGSLIEDGIFANWLDRCFYTH